MTESEELNRFGLARCPKCQRILLKRHLGKKGVCEDGTDCILIRQLAWMARSGFQPSARELRWLEAMDENDA